MNKVLFLDVSNIIKIIKIIGIENIFTEVKNEIKKDYMNWDNFQKSSRTVNDIKEGVIELMPISNNERYSFKYVNGHPKNINYNLPTIMGFGMLSDMKTGIPLLLSEMTLLTAIRTASTSVLLAELLGRKNSKTMAVIGNGCQSEFQILAFYYVLGINNFKLYDIDINATNKLINNLSKYKDINCIICNSVKEAVKNSDIITTITADKKNSIIIDELMIDNGQHYNAVGGDCHGKTELSSKILEKAIVVVEYEKQTRIEGEIQQMDMTFPVIELKDLLNNPLLGRNTDKDITVFDSVGFALEDYSILNYIYKIAIDYNIGEFIDIIPKFNDPKNLFELII
jgi:ornithine cyclodeaminase